MGAETPPLQCPRECRQCPALSWLQGVLEGRLENSPGSRSPVLQPIKDSRTRSGASGVVVSAARSGCNPSLEQFAQGHCSARHETTPAPLPSRALPCLLFLGKIKSRMFAAARIKPCSAGRAPVPAFHVLLDAHLHAARAAQHRPLSPLRPRPRFDCMAGQRLMAILAGVVNAAALHLDGDNVESCPVMRAARLRIEIDPPNLWPLQLHQERFYRRNGAR
jgi:hypothetical protein